MIIVDSYFWQEDPNDMKFFILDRDNIVSATGQVALQCGSLNKIIDRYSFFLCLINFPAHVCCVLE